MSYSDSFPSFGKPPQPTYPGSDAIGIWPEFGMNDGQFDPHSDFEQPQHQPPFKRPRHSDDSQSNVLQCTPTNPRMPLNPPVNKGTTNIFFKTRMCAKFRMGACRNGEGCNFAHGVEDLRQPPPNWQELVGGREEERPAGNWDDDQRIIQRMKLCKKFYNGEECPYGDRCNFLHEDPSKFRDDSGRFRECSAISIGTTAPPTGPVIPPDQLEVNRPVIVSNTVSDAFRGGNNMKPVYWKTKLCVKWETTGYCPFGDKCHFAHGHTELQGFGGRVDGDLGNSGMPRNGSISTKIYNLPVNDAPPVTATIPSINEETQAKKCLFKWKGARKINRIYGDWLDDMPLVHNLPNQVES
ncbi:Zinc finger, CCCH-type [Corchorus capsularis]|uniref:Zinc finger, CCCH-type n=1 Tax=Corchorus capsularis TaxID=210143 RepID=A0A1R3IFD4_COCAP|nr:Zinc finger, CCCH-type [Corchorus capsularis]